jgi:hypothetical protein
MLVSDTLLVEIHSIFSDFVAAGINGQGDFLQKNRKKLKILIETITEQLIASHFYERFVNVPTALLVINTRIQELTDPNDATLFRSLQDVLRHYEILADKSYIDHKPKLEPLFRREIKILCMNIALDKGFVRNGNAAKLRGLLHGC